MANRFDLTTTKNYKLDGNDNLIIKATPTRSGVFNYYNNEGKLVRELRHEDDVFSRETMDSMNGVIYTTQSNHVSLISPKDAQGKIYGFTLQNATRVDDHSEIDIKVTVQSEIDEIMGGGSLELSQGYSCDVVPESGTHKGEKYDARQKNIRYNHTARVEKARGGNTCRFRLDSDSAISGVEAERIDSSKTSQKETQMAELTKVIFKGKLPLRESGEFKLDAQDFEIDESEKGLIEKFDAREEKLFSEIKNLNSSLTEQSVKMDSLTSENKTLSETAKDNIPKAKFDEAVQEGIKSRVGFVGLAEILGIKDHESMSTNDLGKAACVESGMYNKEKLDSDPAYLKYSKEHILDDHTIKVLKSRTNLELHLGGQNHFDEDDALENAQ